MNKYGNGFSGLRILECIRQQIEDYFLYLVSVYPQLELRLFGFENKINLVRFGYGFKILHNLMYKRDDINLFDAQFHLVILYLTEIQNLIDKSQHPMCITFYHLQLFAYILT